MSNNVNEDEYVNRFLQDIQATELTAGNVLSVCASVMQMAENIPKATGEQKKSIVQKVMVGLAQRLNVDQRVLETIPYFIDIAISIWNKDITFEKLAENTGKICCACFPCLKC